MITIHVENLPEFTRDWNLAIGTIVMAVQTGVELGIQEGISEALSTRHWQDRTGEAHRNTRGYLDHRTQLGAEGWMECLVDYASFLEEGTEPHWIRPKAAWGTPAHQLKAGQTVRASGKGPHEHIVGRGQFLRWKDSGGEQHFAREVWHPGTKVDGFMARGVQKAERVVEREFERGVVTAQRRWFDE